MGCKPQKNESLPGSLDMLQLAVETRNYAKLTLAIARVMGAE